MWPQEAQYIPGPWLKEGKNELIFLEVEKSPAEAKGLFPVLCSRPSGSSKACQVPFLAADQHTVKHRCNCVCGRHRCPHHNMAAKVSLYSLLKSRCKQW